MNKRDGTATGGIVVGVDGSEASLAALRWAATEAWVRDVELRVLLAYGSSVDVATLTTALSEARTVARGLAVTGHAVHGSPAKALLEAATGADLVVVGHRGVGGFHGLLAGSVSMQLATHATSPVVVVRGRGNSAIGPIVVGYDGSASSDTVLGTAFDAAAARGGAHLDVVMANPTPVVAHPIGVPPLTYDPAQLATDLGRSQAAALEPWREKYPQVSVYAEVVTGGPAAVLTDRSRCAQLVVVGSRGHGGFTGLLLGSVGQTLVQHAGCPVLIARSHP
jgi:nucleotide-binding universal stress UspA family protein